MTRELLPALLSIVILLNVGVITFAIGSRRARAAEPSFARTEPSWPATGGSVPMPAWWSKPDLMPRHIGELQGDGSPGGAARARSGARATASRAVPAVPSGPSAVALDRCVSCGLSLSATARFCRRCGSRQTAETRQGAASRA